jgi:hypothetical protein
MPQAVGADPQRQTWRSRGAFVIAAIAVGSAMFVCGIPASLGFGLWADVGWGGRPAGRLWIAAEIRDPAADRGDLSARCEGHLTPRRRPGNRIGTSAALGVNADPFLMAVAIGASCAFLTPIGHQNNTLILGPGGLRFGDYWRLGLPVELLVIAVAIPMLLVVWPL